MLDWEASGVLFSSRGRGWCEESSSDAARRVRADNGVERVPLTSGDHTKPHCGRLGHSSCRTEAMRDDRVVYGSKEQQLAVLNSWGSDIIAHMNDALL